MSPARENSVGDVSAADRRSASTLAAAASHPCPAGGCCPTPTRCAAPALVMHGVSAGYERRHAIVHDLDLEIPEGECWAILGPSGCGKTTLLRVVLGMLRPARGHIARPTLAGRRGARDGEIGYIPQNLGLVRHLSVRHNVLLGALSRMPWWRSLFGRFPAAELARADEALADVGLAGRGDERAHTLSGGERRRVAIARAIVQRPRLLLADEFLAELDANTAHEIIDLLQTLRRTHGFTIVFVDHDVETACRIADRVVVLCRGRKVAELDPAATSTDAIRELFRAPLVA
jgi:phosphonate transport system ATP-binding protein